MTTPEMTPTTTAAHMTLRCTCCGVEGPPGGCDCWKPGGCGSRWAHNGTRCVIGHFYTEARARDLVVQFVALGRPAEIFAVERDQFGEWRVYVGEVSSAD